VLIFGRITSNKISTPLPYQTWILSMPYMTLYLSIAIVFKI
jgi:hypothetical protein